MSKYFFPFGWFFYTRVEKISILNLITFFMYYGFPSCYFVLNKMGLSRYSFTAWFLSFCAMFFIYEIGYIFNDLITTRFEENPTLRIKKNNCNTALKYMELLILSRVIFVMFVLKLLESYYYIDTWRAIWGLLFMAVIYGAHNILRGKINILTFFLLINFKYLLPIIILLDFGYFIDIYVIIFVVIILGQTIAYISEKKWYKSLEFIPCNIDVLRVKFYGLLLITGVFFYGSSLACVGKN